jgi:hypothetical protein
LALALRPVDSRKIIGQAFSSAVSGLTPTVVNLLQGVDPVNATLANEGGTSPKCETGRNVRMFEIQHTIYVETVAVTPRHYTVFLRKNEKALYPAPTVGTGSLLGGQIWKDRIFHAEQAQPGIHGNGVPMIFHIRFKIPRRFKRMEFNDVWEIWTVPMDAVAADTYNTCTMWNCKVYT